MKSIETKLNDIVGKYIDITVHSPEESLFMPPASLKAYEVAQLLIEIEEAFSIDLNLLVSRLSKFSFDEICNELLKAK